MRPYRYAALALLVLGACSEAPRRADDDASVRDLAIADTAAVADAPVDSTLPDAVAPDAPSDAAVQAYARCMPGDPEVKLVAETPPPSPLKGGKKVAVSLTLANCGSETWRKADPNAAKGFKLGSQAPDNNERWGISRVALPDDVAPSHSVSIGFTVTAPTLSGTYDYRWAIVDEWVRWLEAPSPLHRIAVQGSAPTFTYHPRADWTRSTQPVSGPAMDVMALRYITIHYNGGNADLDGADNIYQDSDFIALLRAAHNDYLVNRGYSLGYNSIIGPDGAEWEVRGMDYRSAANGCTAVNVPGYAIQVMMPSVSAQPTATQIAGLKAAIARVRAFVKARGNNDHLELNGHRDVRPLCGNGGTACPGDPIYALLKAGQLEP